MSDARKEKKRMGAKILVVDDEESLRMLLCDNLEFEGFQSLSVENGKNAIDVALREIPQLAVIDIGLPDIDGWEVCRRLREDARTKMMPVVVLSGSIGGQIDKVAKDNGVQYCVAKPYNCATLIDLIKKILNVKA
ncbi:MAG: response regulator [Elusimicrobia bacterium]|nr:response regulator [Elusimicrobiota bacterium]